MNKEQIQLYLKLISMDANKIRSLPLSPAQMVATLNDISNYVAFIQDEMEKMK